MSGHCSGCASSAEQRVDDDDNQERQVSQTVADVLLDMLEQTGVKQIFGLIGDSLNPLADAIP
jgi:hypothetical protein